MSLTRTEALRLARVMLQYFQRHFDTDVSAPRLLTLVGIAENPDSPQFELGGVIGLPSSATVSRNINDLTHLTSRREPGPGYVRQDPDPNSRRRNLVRLTPRGEVLIEGLVKELNKALEKKT